MKNIKQKLNEHFKNWKPTTKAIVVGTSPSLTWYEFGPYIDQFDVVIRINLCFTPDLYAFTGKKIDIWATTDNTRWDLWTPVTNTTKEVWTRNDSVINDLNNNGTFDIFDERKFTGIVKPMNTRYSLNFPYLSLGTGLIALNEAISEYGKITAIGHTFYLESEGPALNFDNKGVEDEEHKRNREKYFNGDLHGSTQIQYVLDWIKEDKVTLLNPYEYNNLRIPIA